MSGDDGVDEVDPRNDPLSRRACYERDGYLLLPGFLDPTSLVPLTDAVDRPGGTRRHHLDRGELRFHSNLFRRHHGVAALATDPAIALLLMELTGGTHWVRWDQLVEKAPGGARFPWHQDNAYSRLGHPHVQLWVALCDMDERNGGLWVDPGSHRCGPLRHRREGTHRVCEKPPQDPRPIDAKVGDVVAFSSFMLHATTPNETSLRRAAYVVEYLAVGHADPGVRRPYLLVGEGGADAVWTTSSPGPQRSRDLPRRALSRVSGLVRRD